MEKIRMKSIEKSFSHEILNSSPQYYEHLRTQTNIGLTSLQIPQDYQFFNPHFMHLRKWVGGYIGPGTSQLLSLTKIITNDQSHPSLDAIQDENRNAILPERSIHVDGRQYYVSIKGCGAYEDMFMGGPLKLESLQTACRDSQLLPFLNHLTNYQGFIMAENWMGESPYGAQGEENGFDELEFSKLATPFDIQGAYICPLIGLVRLPDEVESLARKFFWYRTYPKHFYQAIRLVPSRIRLYFESSEVLRHPEHIFSMIGLKTIEDIRGFELNFIRSGISLLSLFSRSAKIENGLVSGLIYQDVWLDKDAILALDGVIHFADLEGLMYKTVSLADYPEIQRKEWQKLVFEFLYALNNLDLARRKLEKLTLDFRLQRQELGTLIQDALEFDPITYTSIQRNTLYIIIHRESFPAVEIPFLESIYS